MTSKKETKILEPGQWQADAPVQKPQGDLFGRATYAQNLASAIQAMDATEGFVIGLNGPWGSGKTSFLNFVLAHIRETAKDGIAIIHFNPWWFSGQENLLMGFFDEFRTALGVRKENDSLKKIGPLLESFGGSLAQFSGLSGAALRLLGSAVQIGEQKNVHQIRDQIDTALRKQERRILVVIDDIDRLQADEIRQVFSLVKSVANFPQTIYLLCFDQSAVAQALDSVQTGKGEKYIEKIVQMSVELPMIPRFQLHDFLIHRLDRVMSLSPKRKWDNDRWRNLCWNVLEPFLRTPREVNRLVNSIACTYPVIASEVDAVDFIGVQALRIIAPDMHQFVMTCKEPLTQGIFSPLPDYLSDEADLCKKKRKFFEKTLHDFVPEERQSAVSAIMSCLFPHWSKSLEGLGEMDYFSNDSSSQRRQGRICDAECFDRYFSLIVQDGIIPALEMERILETANNEKKFSNALLRLKKERGIDGKTKLRQFLDRMMDYAEKDIPQDHIKTILAVFFDKADDFIVEEKDEEFFELDNEVLMDPLISKLLKRIESKDERFNILQSVISKGRAIFFIVHEVSIFGWQHGKYSSGKKLADEPLITLSDQEKLEAIALHKVREAINAGTLSATPKLAGVLYRLTEWGHEDEVLRYMSNLIETDEGLCDFLAGCLSYVISTDGNHYAISTNAIAKFTDDWESLLPRCEKILEDAPKWLSGKRKTGLRVFVGTMRGKLRPFG